MISRKTRACIFAVFLAGSCAAACAQASAPGSAPACCGRGAIAPSTQASNTVDTPYTFLFVEKTGDKTYRTVAAAQAPQTDYFYLTHSDGIRAWRLSGAYDGPPSDRRLEEHSFFIESPDGNQLGMTGNGGHVEPGKVIAFPTLRNDIGDCIFLLRRAAPDAPELTQEEIAGAVDTEEALFKNKKLKEFLAKRAKDAPKALPPAESEAIVQNPAVKAFCEAPVRQRLEDYPEVAAAPDKNSFIIQALERLLNAPQPDSLPYLFKLQQVVTFIQRLPHEAVDKEGVPALAYHLVNTVPKRSPQLPVEAAALEALQAGTLELFTTPYLKEHLNPWKSYWQRESLFLFAQQQAANLQEKLPPGWYVASLKVADTGKRLYVADAAALAVEADKPARVSARMGDDVFTFNGTLPSGEIKGYPIWGEFSLENHVTTHTKSIRTNVLFSKTPMYTGGSLGDTVNEGQTRLWDYFFVLHVPPGPRLTLLWAKRSSKNGPYRIVFSQALPEKVVFLKGKFIEGKLLSLNTAYQRNTPRKEVRINADVSDPKTQAQSRIFTKFALGGPDGLFVLGNMGPLVGPPSEKTTRDGPTEAVWLIRQSAGEAPLPTPAEIEKAMAATIP